MIEVFISIREKCVFTQKYLIAMVINREFYLNKLIERRRNGRIKVITGIRRCGKSVLLFELFRNYLKNGNYIRINPKV